MIKKSSGYSQSASLLAHNQIAATQLIRRGLPPLLIQASSTPAYCFSQLKQGTYLIWLKSERNVSRETFLSLFSHQEKQTDNQVTVLVILAEEDVLLLLKCKSQLPDLILHIERELRS